MENQINTGGKNTQSTAKNSINQPVPLTEKTKLNYWMITTFVLLVIIAVGGIYTFNLSAKLSNNQKENQILITAYPSPMTRTESTPTTAAATSLTDNMAWKTQVIPIQYESEFAGSKNVNVEMKVPSDWTFQTSQAASDPNTSLIKNCSISTISSKDQSMKVTFTPICTGWSAKYSAWPSDAVIALQQKRRGNDGLHNIYRVRYTTSVNNYNYVDAMTQSDQPLDKNKDQVMDVISVGYAPPNENKDDFFAIIAHLTVNYSGPANLKDDFLSLANQIAASLVLK